MTPGVAPTLGRASTIRRLTPLATALEQMAGAATPIHPSRVALEAARGWPLFEDCIAPSALPPVAVALRDGWAVASADTVGATSYAPALLPGVPVMVKAGDPMPAGSDAILPPGALVEEAGTASCLDGVAPGEDVRAAGADVRAGACLAEAGRRVDVPLAAACVAAGLGEVSVRRCPIRLDNEVDPATKGVVAALLGRWAVTDADDAAVRLAAWRNPPADPHGVLFAGLALSPGDAAWAAVESGQIRIHVPPGVGPAAAVALALLVPLVDRLTGAAPRTAPVTRPLARKIASRIGWSELALLNVEGGQWTPIAVADLTIAALARASAWSLTSPDSEGAPAGAPMAGYPFGDRP